MAPLSPPPEAATSSREVRRRRPRKSAARRVVVTGAGGFLGTTLVPQLWGAGWQVATLSRRTNDPSRRPGAITISADVLSSDWERWCEGSTALVHLVGAHRPPRDDPRYDRVHVTATRRAVEACRRLRISRMIAVSAAGARPDAATPYLRSKWAAEEVVRASSLDWTIVRPAPVFGPGDHFSTTLAAALRRAPLVPVPGDGKAALQPIAAVDLATMLCIALDAPASIGGVFDAAGPERLTLDELIRRTAAALGLRRRIVHVPLALARRAVTLEELRRAPRLTQDELTLLLAGVSADSAPASLVFPQPQTRFVGPTWQLATNPS